MSYIIKNTAALINTRLTDVGRRKISQGDFRVAYFQIGDSEVSYTAVPNYNSTNNSILMPAWNAQNDTGVPESNKQNVKYPFYVQGASGNTYGIPYMDSKVEPVYNSAGVKGFFTNQNNAFQIQISSAYTVNSQYIVMLTGLTGTYDISAENSVCSYPDIFTGSGTPEIGDILVLYIPNSGDCTGVTQGNILTYKITGLTGVDTLYPTFSVDRPLPILTTANPLAEARIIIYPGSMVQQIPYTSIPSPINYPYLYDYPTPMPNWEVDTLNFETPCDVTRFDDTKIWNMNIPWSENPAGLRSSEYEDYTMFGSVGYIGSKEYWNYQNESGGTDTGEVFFYNSFDEKVIVRPKDQKCIAIVHYTNQSIDNVYGEKFALLPEDPLNPDDDTGLARHFKVSIPTLLWHKNDGNTFGETFYVEPPNYESLFQEYYLKSTKNVDMNDPGIRYYYLYDTHPDLNGNLNRVGRVFPDQQTIVFDDEEICAALSYKSNRNWTMPAPKLGLITPNICGDESGTPTGILTNSQEYLYVTYRFGNSQLWESPTITADTLHCNYYVRIQGPTGNTTDSNVTVRFGNEFPYMVTSGLNGFSADKMIILAQRVTGDTRPNPNNWIPIDVTNQLTSTMVNGFITPQGISATTFVINTDNYNPTLTPTYYDLGDYVSIPYLGETGTLNFGDEYFFYGNIETDIQATIYEMRYLINLSRNQFTNTSNPTYTSGTTAYVSEIGLYDENKDLIVISKLQSPEIRQGIQQYVVKLDF